MEDMKEAATQPGTEILFLLPNEIQTTEKYDVRVWKSEKGAEVEEQRIRELADSIERDGQLDAGIVVPHLGGSPLTEGYVLVAGGRRRRAITLLNDQLQVGRPPIRMRVIVDRSGGDLFQKALASNIQRKNHSPMELAALIARVRKQNGWTGFPGAKKVAKYIGVNVATVTQHERLLAADPIIQEKLDSGEISAQSAFELMNVKPEKRKEVLETARENQLDATVDRVTRDVKKSKVSAEEAAETIQKKGVSGRIEHPAIRKAIRQHQSAQNATKMPPTRKEIVEWFDEQDGPANGYPDGAVRQFIRYFVDKWAKGEGSERTLGEKFDAMIEKAPRGTAASRQEPEKKAKKK